ncbi:MAG: SHOCT domain-containing protein [Anaerolineales bacterium]|nr:SHOCT domain-containing protein [Anaerolineales bacterium]
MGRKGWLVVAAVVGVGVLVMLVACLALLPSWGAGYGWRMNQTPAPWTAGGPWMMGGWNMMGMMLIWPVLLLVLGALLVAGVVWAVQLSSRSGSQSTGIRSTGDTPSQILRRRYAGGEITKEQFDEMRQTLDRS